MLRIAECRKKGKHNKRDKKTLIDNRKCVNIGVQLCFRRFPIDGPHIAKVVKTYLETLKWEVLLQPPYSPDVAPSDYHLLRSMAHGLADQYFRSYEEVKNWIDSWIASKDDQFFRRGIRTLPMGESSGQRWTIL